MSARISLKGDSCSPGFSLVEVTIALGIVGFSLLALVGSLPVGLRATRDAQDQTTRARILRQVAAETAQVPYSQLTGFIAAGPRFFDNDGVAQASADGDTRYEVSLDQRTITYPGSTNISGLSSSGVTVGVSIKRHPDGSPLSAGTLGVPNIGE
jgi:uncharacterized protein (TIGR02598 family)